MLVGCASSDHAALWFNGHFKFLGRKLKDYKELTVRFSVLEHGAKKSTLAKYTSQSSEIYIFVKNNAMSF